MKNNTAALALILFLSIFISCNKNNTTDPKDEWEPEAAMPALPDTTVNIYLSGNTVNERNESVALYWRNGNPVVLGIETRLGYFASSESISVVNGDVYASGFGENLSPRYWKNGSPVVLTNSSYTGSTSNISISGSDVYVSGLQQDAQGAGAWGYWKNGQRFDTDLLYINGMATNSNDVYIVGTDPNILLGVTVLNICLKNGVPLNLQTQYSKPYTCYEVAAFNGDIFVGGGANVVSTTDSFYSNAAYWKNALEVTVDNEFNSGVHGIFAKDGDVYTCGLLRDGNGITQTKKRAVYWKNQERHILSEEESFASAIIVLNSHVYVCGIIGDKAALWIDGTLFYTLKHTSNFLDMKVVQK